MSENAVGIVCALNISANIDDKIKKIEDRTNDNDEKINNNDEKINGMGIVHLINVGN
jgi:cell division protein ZapA (FtsZ GTPase activity inhibitor)